MSTASTSIEKRSFSDSSSSGFSTEVTLFSVGFGIVDLDLLLLFGSSVGTSSDEDSIISKISISN